jgi:uncharacterized protein (TIGR02594 family)
MKKLIFVLAVMLGSFGFLIESVSAKPNNKRYHYNKKSVMVNDQNLYNDVDEDTAAGFFTKDKERTLGSNFKHKNGTGQIPVSSTKRTGADLINKASVHLGSSARQLGLPNRLWCADFMNMLVGGNDRRAISYKTRGKPAAHGCTNCIAITKRKGGQHVGVVSGYDEAGNPIIISGNHNRRVGIGVYARNKVLAYRYI